jgi:hypothetical protein
MKLSLLAARDKSPNYLKTFLRGLNTLRKNSDSLAKLEKYIPQGLKAALICGIYGTTKVVP